MERNIRMVDRHTYATTDEFRDYLAGTTYASGWTADGVTIRRILEASSRRIDDYCGGGMCGASTQTRVYDIGSGSLRNSPQYTTPTGWGGDISLSNTLSAVIPLDGWLIETTSVTSYKQTERTESETLTEGYANDYLLEPYNFNPKTILKLNEDTTKSFYGGQKTLEIVGTWGYQNEHSVVTTSGAITTTTQTDFGVNGASGLSPAQTILIGSEQMYITSISSNTLTVERGVNGTTASTHLSSSDVSIYIYPELVVQACLDIAKVTYRDRDLGTTLSIGGGDVAPITVVQNEVRNILKLVDKYRVASRSNGVIF